MYNLDIFYYGRRNDEFFRKIEKRRLSLKFNLKYFVWIIMMIVFSSKNKLNINKAYLIYGNMHENIFLTEDSKFKIYHGTILKNISDIKSKVTIMSLWSFKERILLLSKGIYSAVTNKIPFREIWFWVDFVFISEFIEKSNLEELNICGHFDRYAIWVSYLSKENNVIFNISQHGALSEISLPIKVLCDKCLVFNEMEQEFFRKYVILNKDCKYEIKGFKSNIIFKKIKKQDKYAHIGIASQPTFTRQTIEIVNYLHNKYNKIIKIYVYPHPRENFAELVELKKDGKCEIYTDTKHNDLDILVTFYSTVIYDFLSVNKNIQVLCLPPKEVNMSFFYLKEVVLIEEKEAIDEYINKIIHDDLEVMNEDT